MLSILATAGLLPPYLAWSRAQAEAQIDRMQEAAFNTPGAETPVTPAVVAGGICLLAGHFALARLLQLRAGQAWLSMLAGMGGGVGIYLIRAERSDR